MSIPVTEIIGILQIIRSGVEWAQKQKELGNITQEQFDGIFERIEDKKNAWDDLAPGEDK